MPNNTFITYYCTSVSSQHLLGKSMYVRLWGEKKMTFLAASVALMMIIKSLFVCSIKNNKFR